MEGICQARQERTIIRLLPPLEVVLGWCNAAFSAHLAVPHTPDSQLQNELTTLPEVREEQTIIQLLPELGDVLESRSRVGPPSGGGSGRRARFKDVPELRQEMLLS